MLCPMSHWRVPIPDSPCCDDQEPTAAESEHAPLPDELATEMRGHGVFLSLGG
jgi:hypothetical protein